MMIENQMNLDNRTMTNQQPFMPNMPEMIQQMAQQIAQQMAQQMMQNIGALKGDNILFTDFAKEWFAYKSPTLSQSTQERNTIIYKADIKPFFACKTLTTISVGVLQEYLNMQSKTHKPSTMKVIKSIIGQIMAYADARDLIRKNPINFVSIPKGEEDHKRALTADEIKRLLKASHTHRLWIAPILLLCTGMRRSEMLALTWNDIDFAKAEINIDKGYVKTPKGDNNMLNGTKTKKSKRKIAIDEKLVSLLKFYKARHGENRTYVIGQVHNDKMIAPRVFDRTLKKWCEIAHIEKVSSHCFRHTYATMAYDCKQQTLTIARQLGHSTTRMVEQVYIHQTTGIDQKQCARDIGSKIFGSACIL
jgi:integrase